MKNNFFLLTLLLLSGCKPTPKPIEYGSDACAFCQMTIVDQQHGAELVTRKGRVFKFDAIECMVNYAVQQGPEEFALFLTNVYTQPGTLEDARSATYLISKEVPSPMGAFLSAFSDSAEAEAIRNSKGGTLYTWQEILSMRREKGILGPSE